MSAAAEIIDRYGGNGYGEMIVEEADHAALDRALAAAVIEKESDFRNILGCDHGNSGDWPPYCQHVVTRERVQALIASPYENGVGLTQLTYTPFLIRADSLGGAHLSRNQCRVAFELLMTLLSTYSYQKALAAYNAGEGNWINGIEYADDVAARHEVWKKRLNGSNNGGGTTMATANDIVRSAQKLLGAPYRVWYEGMSIPTWLDDGVGDPPSVQHLQRVGLQCADLVDYALEDNGLESIGGTLSIMDYLVDPVPFDPSTPGAPGMVAYKQYQGPNLADQGHVAIYVDEHTLIQALGLHGVTDRFTDTETYYWGGSTAFEWYAALPGVDYSDTGTGGGEPSSALQGEYVAIAENGLWVTEGDNCSRGWYDLPSWSYNARRWTRQRGYF